MVWVFISIICVQRYLQLACIGFWFGRTRVKKQEITSSVLFAFWTVCKIYDFEEKKAIIVFSSLVWAATHPLSSFPWSICPARTPLSPRCLWIIHGCLLPFDIFHWHFTKNKPADLSQHGLRTVLGGKNKRYVPDRSERLLLLLFVFVRRARDYQYHIIVVIIVVLSWNKHET